MAATRKAADLKAAKIVTVDLRDHNEYLTVCGIGTQEKRTTFIDGQGLMLVYNFMLFAPEDYNINLGPGIHTLCLRRLQPTDRCL